MQQRNVLSLIRKLSGIACASLAFSMPAIAQSGENFPLLSLLMSPSIIEMSGSAPSDILVVEELRAAPQLPNTIDLTTAPDSLWDHIRNGFAMTDLNDPLVLHYQQWYQNRPEALRRMVERSRPYLHHIVSALEARGMPTELALLPMVESSFNPMAYSRAHASGLWQFIPATGKRFNLEQNWWQDQRRDILASTNAALDYLQTIYDMHGDWHLALASYNWGEGAVKRAIEKNGARGLPTDYPNLAMPMETRHYVPKLQALKNIFSDPALTVRIGIPDIPNQPYFATLAAPQPMDVKTAARLAGLTVDEFVRLNPSHNRQIIKPETPLIVPADRVDSFRDRLLASHDRPLSNWQAYTLPVSERLDSIASRFGISLGELLQANGLSSNARLGAGSRLLVPGQDHQHSLNAMLQADGPQYWIDPERVARGKKGKASKTASLKSAGKLIDRLASGKAATATASRALAGKGGAGKLAAREAVASTKSAKAARPVVDSKRAAAPKAAAPAKVAKSGNSRRG